MHIENKKTIAYFDKREIIKVVWMIKWNLFLILSKF